MFKKKTRKQGTILCCLVYITTNRYALLTLRHSWPTPGRRRKTSVVRWRSWSGSLIAWRRTCRTWSTTWRNNSVATRSSRKNSASKRTWCVCKFKCEETAHVRVVSVGLNVRVCRGKKARGNLFTIAISKRQAGILAQWSVMLQYD